jgi:hypothetical protein
MRFEALHHSHEVGQRARQSIQFICHNTIHQACLDIAQQALQRRPLKGPAGEAAIIIAVNLNAGLGDVDAWNEIAIQERAGRLADQALLVWSAPKLDAEKLAAYLPQRGAATGGCSRGAQAGLQECG